ncbi:Ig-like domain-containing protein [Sulfurimonas sp.]|uniref:Ig-like domain-containing protein n=2 Tax=Sulfurimonas sp. TaxID=2022749 RepID=UPI003D0F5ECB
MATGKVIGQIQVTEGNIKIVGVDGVVREPSYEGYVYENEQVISSDANALFQIKFLALPEAVAYDGIFKILADGSVVHGRDAMESVASDESLADAIKTASGEGDMEDLETAAGEEGAEGSSSFTETDIVASSSVLGFFRGTNGELGFGITEFATVPNEDAGEIAPPAITSPNVVIYDENDTIPVIQVTATAEGSVTYSIAGLDSEHFNIDSATGLITFKQSPDFENPKDTESDNEYNMYVTVTDQYGNYTTQLLSVSVNNVNEAVTAVDDTISAVEDMVISSTIDLDANDYDVDGDNLTVVAGEFTTQEGGNILINTDGSYTYTPPANFNGTDSVNYTVTDGEFTDVGLLTINVGAVNDATQINDDSATTDEDTSVTIDVLANDTDEDSPVSPVASVTNGSNGTVVINEDGTLTYTPDPNFSGEDSFTYTNMESNGATVNVTVNATADIPNLSISIKETEEAKSERVIDEEANEEAGIYQGEDGLYYKDEAVVISDEYGMNSKLNQGHFITFEQSMELADVVKLATRFTGTSYATIQFYEGETLVDELPLLGEKSVSTLNTYTPNESFDKIVFVIDGDHTSAIFLESYSFEYLVPTVVDPITKEVITTVYEYTITPESELTDDSEELSEVEINLGEALEGVDLVDNDDGTYTFESDEQLSSDVLDGITASITSTEDSNGDEATIIVNQNGIVSIVGGSGSDAIEYDEYDTFDTEIDGGDGFDTVIGDSEEIDLSNVSNIEVIQLNSDATVIGSGDGNSINPDDVLSATNEGVLIIQSDDGDASTQAYADSTFGDATTVVIDGNSYAQYINGDATLLIQIEDIDAPL